MTTLKISGITVFAKVGIHKWEQNILRRITINLAFKTSTFICYSHVKQLVVELIEGAHFGYIEDLAHAMLLMLKKHFQHNDGITVEIIKPEALYNTNPSFVIEG